MYNRRKLIPKQKLENQFNHLEKSINDITRWSKFRDKRKDIIDKYIKIKKKQLRIEKLIMNIKASNIVKMVYTNFTNIMENRNHQHKMSMVCVKIYCRWLRKLK